MRVAIIALSCLALSACKPSEMFGPGSAHNPLPEPTTVETSIGVPAPEPRVFPSGQWDDGFGQVWTMMVSDDTLVGQMRFDDDVVLTMTGVIRNELLTYQVFYQGGVPVAQGLARLTDDSHALFETYNLDGSPNAHGLLHFGHPAQEPVAPAAEPVPQADEPDTPIKGD